MKFLHLLSKDLFHYGMACLDKKGSPEGFFIYDDRLKKTLYLSPSAPSPKSDPPKILIIPDHVCHWESGMWSVQDPGTRKKIMDEKKKAFGHAAEGSKVWSSESSFFWRVGWIPQKIAKSLKRFFKGPVFMVPLSIVLERLVSKTAFVRVPCHKDILYDYVLHEGCVLSFQAVPLDGTGTPIPPAEHQRHMAHELEESFFLSHERFETWAWDFDALVQNIQRLPAQQLPVSSFFKVKAPVLTLVQKCQKGVMTTLLAGTVLAFMALFYEGFLWKKAYDTLQAWKPSGHQEVLLNKKPSVISLEALDEINQRLKAVTKKPAYECHGMVLMKEEGRFKVHYALIPRSLDTSDALKHGKKALKQETLSSHALKDLGFKIEGHTKDPWQSVSYGVPSLEKPFWIYGYVKKRP